MNDHFEEGLSAEALFVIPRRIDWRETYKAERWEIIYPEFSELSLDDLESITGEEFESGDGMQRTVEEYYYENSHQLEPMYNYWYPLPHLSISAEVAQARLIKNGNVCTVVNLDDESVLALAGCGMDFSWDICRAYILLSYLPPFHFCNLPKIGSLKSDVAMGACQRS